MTRLRVVTFVDQFPELSETFITAELQELRRQGHEVRVESRAPAANPYPAAATGLAVAFREDDRRLRRARDLAWLLARHPLRCLRDLLSRPRWRREESVRRLRELAPVAGRANRAGDRHIHAHFAAGAALDAMRVGALLRLPYSVATHGYDIFQSPANLREKHERAAFAVSACDYSVEAVRALIGPEHRRRVHKLVVGVDAERLRRRAPYPGRGEVLALARLVEKKGLRHLIEAAALLAERDSNLKRVRVGGDGPLRAALESLAAELSVEVEFLGAQAPAGVPPLLEEADLVAVPCVLAADGDRDTMPVVIKEALAMEVPVVASDAFGLPEAIRPEWGRLVPPGDSGALAEAIDELLSLSPEQRVEMGKAGRAWVLECANLERETRKLAGLIAASAGTARTLLNR